MYRNEFKISKQQKELFTLTKEPVKFYEENWGFIVHKTKEKLIDWKFVIVESKKKKEKFLRIECDNKLYYISQLIAIMKCNNCNSDFDIRRQHIFGIIRGETLNKTGKYLCTKCAQSLSHKTDEYKRKYNKTMMERYGARCPLKVKKIRNKMNQTMLSRYGVKYSGQSEDLRNKMYATKLKKYGMRSITGPKKSGKFASSKLEIEIVNLIKKKLFDAGFNFTYYDYSNRQFWISDNLKSHPVDFYIKELKYVLEIDGDWYHGNPEIYKQNELHPLIDKTFGELYSRTQLTTEWLVNHKQVVRVRRFWNSEIEKNIELTIKIILEDIKELYERKL